MKIEELGKIVDNLLRHCDTQDKINKSFSEFIAENVKDIRALNIRVDELKEENRRLIEARSGKESVKGFMGEDKEDAAFDVALKKVGL